MQITALVFLYICSDESSLHPKYNFIICQMSGQTKPHKCQTGPARRGRHRHRQHRRQPRPLARRPHVTGLLPRPQVRHETGPAHRSPLERHEAVLRVDLGLRSGRSGRGDGVRGCRGRRGAGNDAGRLAAETG